MTEQTTEAPALEPDHVPRGLISNLVSFFTLLFGLMLTVSGPGPELPADGTTRVPAFQASSI